MVLLRQLFTSFLFFFSFFRAPRPCSRIDLLSLVAVLGISQQAELHPRPWQEGKLHSSTETLVLLWVIVLQPIQLMVSTNFLSSGLFHQRDVLTEQVSVQLGRQVMSP